MTNAESYLYYVLKHRNYLDGFETSLVSTLVGMGRLMKRNITSKQYAKLREIAKRIEIMEEAHANPKTDAELEKEYQANFHKMRGEII